MSQTIPTITTSAALHNLTFRLLRLIMDQGNFRPAQEVDAAEAHADDRQVYLRLEMYVH